MRLIVSAMAMPRWTADPDIYLNEVKINCNTHVATCQIASFKYLFGLGSLGWLHWAGLLFGWFAEYHSFSFVYCLQQADVQILQ